MGPASRGALSSSVPRRGAAPRQLALVLALGTIAAGALLTGCQQGGGDADARAACRYVTSSVQLFDRSSHDTGAAASADQAAALSQLRLALPQAALASTMNSSWDALVTTLSETNRVPEANLVSALSQQCSVFTTQTSTQASP